MTKLEHLKAAYEAATPGEWVNSAFHVQSLGGPLVKDVSVATVTGEGLTDVYARANASFISLAHNLMPHLLEAATELARFIDYLDTASGDGAYEHEIQRALAILEKLK